MKALARRKGKIVIGKDFFDLLGVEDLSAIFRNFFPFTISTEMLYTGNLVYYGCSIFFDPIEEGSLIPEYLIEIRSEKSKNISSIRFVKQDINPPNEVKRGHRYMM